MLVKVQESGSELTQTELSGTQRYQKLTSIPSNLNFITGTKASSTALKGEKNIYNPFSSPVKAKTIVLFLQQMTENTHSEIFNLFMKFQFLKKRLEKVNSLDVTWSHTQSINISSWKTAGMDSEPGPGWMWLSLQRCPSKERQFRLTAPLGHAAR